MLKLTDDPQLAYRMVECGCAEALEKIIETPPEKDDETKQLVLEILNNLFAVKGVLHKIVAKHGKGVLKMFMNTDQTKLAKNVIDCLHNTAGEGLEELDNESLAKMNQLVNSHQKDHGVNVSGSLYIKNLFDSSKPDRIKNCGITVRDIVRSFGPHNMDEQVFRNLDVAIDKIGTEQEFYSVLDDIQKNPNSDDFWIMSHLVDLPSVDIDSKKSQLESIINCADTNNLVSSLNSEVCFFLKELHRARPEMSKSLMHNKASLIKKIMDEIDNISGPHKFLGLQVLEQNIDAHGKFMRENDIIKKAQKWIAECESPDDMIRILNFLSAFSGNKEFKEDMLSSGLDKLAIDHCKAKFADNPKVFDALYGLMDNGVATEKDIVNFCDNGNMGEILNMAAVMVDDIAEMERFIEFTCKMLDVPNPSPKLQDSFNQLTRVFCTQFERRISEFFQSWYDDKGKKEVWSQSYKPEFMECISTEKERRAIKKLMENYDTSKVEEALHKSAIGDRGMEVLNSLSQNLAIFVCCIAKEEPETFTQLTYRVPIDDAVQSLKNNLEFITDKQLKTRVVSRYMALFCALLPLFRQKAFIKKIAAKRSEFCCQEFINIIDYASGKQPVVAFYMLSAYGLYFIPEGLKPEVPTLTTADGEEEKAAATFQTTQWTPLTFILNDNAISAPILDCLLKIGKKKPELIVPFMGYLSLGFAYNYGTQDTDLILDSALLNSLIAQVDEESLEYGLATSAIHSMDSWCEGSEKAAYKLNSMGAYDKLLRYMNNLRNQDILKLVISSLLQKLANFNDGQQLEYDLERLVKKCKDYADNCATKGDQQREEILAAYNELSGLLQIQKAQQYCINKQLQNATLRTLATELRRSPEDLLAKGLIVNYQDLLGKLISANTNLFERTKSKPDDITNASHILKRSIDHWKNDASVMKGILEMTKNIVKKKGQFEYSPEMSQSIHQSLEDLILYNRNNEEFVQLARDVQGLLDLSSTPEEEAPAPEEQVPTPESPEQPAEVEPENQEQPEQEPEVPAEPKGPIEEEAPITAQPEPEEVEVAEEEMHAPPPIEAMEEEAEQARELKESFVTEAVFATTQDTAEEQRIAEEYATPAVPEEPVVYAEPEVEEAAPEPENQEPPTEDFNLRVEADRQKAATMISAKEANPDDPEQDGYIYMIQLKAEELDYDELILAIFYAKWVFKVASIQNIRHYSTNPLQRLMANLERFEGHPDLLKATCQATSAITKDDPNEVSNFMSIEFITPLRAYVASSNDAATIVNFARTVCNVTQPEENKIALSQKGVIRVFTNAISGPLRGENDSVLKFLFKAVNSLCTSKTSCPMNTEKTDFVEKLIDFAAESIPNAPIICLVLETFGVIFKFGGEKVRNMAVENGATNLYTEDDIVVMKPFYISAGCIGDIQSFWKNLDSVSLSDFIFGNLTSYTVDIVKPSLVCLVFLTKIDDTCDKAVESGLYRWLDPCIRAHNDTMVLSYILVIENAITATMKRQNRLNEERFYDVVMQYHPEVVATKNDKLLILWLSVLCKLTNNRDSCASLLAYLYPTLDGLLREHYYTEPVFEKIYNLMTNILLGSHCPSSEVDVLLHLTFHKLSVGTSTENFFMLYINFIEKLAAMQDNAEVIECVTGHQESIVGSMHSVPLLLRHISDNVQSKFSIMFPRSAAPINIPPFLKTSLDGNTIAALQRGSPCKRYRPQAVIEQGTLFLDKGIKHLVFQRNNSLSVMSRDIIFLGDIIKIVKGHDDRSMFAEAIKKYNLTIPQEVSLMILSSKISYGETGFYIQFNDKDARTLWKESIRVFIEEVEQKKT